MVTKKFDFAGCLEIYESELKLSDPRSKLLQSLQQRMVYTFARINGFLTIEDIEPLYKDKERASEQIKQMLFFGFLKPTFNEDIYAFVEYKKPKGSGRT